MPAPERVARLHSNQNIKKFKAVPGVLKIADVIIQAAAFLSRQGQKGKGDEARSGTDRGIIQPGNRHQAEFELLTRM
jgi:hypothetical protein